MTPSEPAFWIDWLRRQALPLWSDAGFDADRGSFVERLALDGTPQQDVPRRLMVQARQIHVFATAARNGWFPAGADLALRAGDAMIARYAGAGGRHGWAFSCTRRGDVLDHRRDLYAHAFVLLALADLICLDGNSKYIELVHETLAFLDRDMAHPAGGYVEQWPAASLPRRQNPHMHLLEAFLALQETGACQDCRPRMAAMVDLFDRRFFSTEDNVLSEYFGEQWAFANDVRAFEPGHHFEWVWLLDRYAASNGFDMGDRIGRLLRTGLDGIDGQGRVIDQMGLDGPLATSCRLWPTMEGAKALCVPLGRVARPSGMADALNAAWRAFLAPAAPGGWIDRLDPLGAPQVDHIPASSLYHICTALDYVAR